VREKLIIIKEKILSERLGMRKIIASAGMVFIFWIQMMGQTPVKLLPVHLSQGEEVLQVAAQEISMQP
jgi:hypothetical protein